jgi:hypothetical protein
MGMYQYLMVVVMNTLILLENKELQQNVEMGYSMVNQEYLCLMQILHLLSLDMVMVKNMVK